MRRQHFSDSLLRAAGSLLVAAVALVPTTVLADASWVTADHIIAAILETGSYTAEQLADLDLNNDGEIDATDLVCFSNGCHRQANFRSVFSEVEEGEGSFEIGVDFGIPVSCDLVVAVIGGTATATVDYLPPPTLNPVSGAAVSLTVSVIDDPVVSEEIEMFTVEIRPGTCYTVGGVNQHTVRITDNDAVWYGTLRDDVTTLGFTMEIVQADAGTSGSLTSDGYGTLPAGTWPAAPLTFAPGVGFAALVGPVVMDSSITSFAADINRTFSFIAAGTDVREDAIEGTYQESISLPDPSDAHLATTINGEFTLIKEVALPSSWDPPPEDHTARRR